MNISVDRLAALRGQIEEKTLDGYILPYGDEWQSHFVPPGANRLRWLTGFTGSAGMAVILKDKAVILSDSRYTIQLGQQVDTKLYETGDTAKMTIGEWISGHAQAGFVIGYDPALISSAQREVLVKELEKSDVSLMPVNGNLVDPVWGEKHVVPAVDPVRIFPDKIAGKSAGEKIDEIIGALKEESLDFYIVTQSTALCWMLNVRGDDTPCLPVIHSYAIIDCNEGEVRWFVEEERTSADAMDHIGSKVKRDDPDTLDLILKKLKGRVGLDKSAPDRFYLALSEGDAAPVFFKNPAVKLMALKTPAEVQAMKDVHVRDGIAVTKLLHWLQTASHSDLYESDIAAKFEEMRGHSNSYRGPSFPPIIGYGANGAIVHYTLEEGQQGALLDRSGMLLTDTGGQYEEGTTDITRTVFYGDDKPSEDMKCHFTLVLKGHIALATARFPKGTTGAQVDTLARKALWADGLNYGHGTGHGVGTALDVHEESANIHPRSTAAFEPGMIITNEPGYYREGHYGIRIENILTVKESAAEGMLEFETITLAPVDKNLIDDSLLEKPEREWLNAYHARVYDSLSPHLEGDVLEWLKDQIEPL